MEIVETLKKIRLDLIKQSTEELKEKIEPIIEKYNWTIKALEDCIQVLEKNNKEV